MSPAIRMGKSLVESEAVKDQAKSDYVSPKRGICGNLCSLWDRHFMARKTGKGLGSGKGGNSVYVAGSYGDSFI